MPLTPRHFYHVTPHDVGGGEFTGQGPLDGSRIVYIQFSGVNGPLMKLADAIDLRDRLNQVIAEVQKMPAEVGGVDG